MTTSMTYPPFPEHVATATAETSPPEMGLIKTVADETPPPGLDRASARPPYQP